MWRMIWRGTMRILKHRCEMEMRSATHAKPQRDARRIVSAATELVSVHRAARSTNSEMGMGCGASVHRGC